MAARPRKTKQGAPSEGTLHGTDQLPAEPRGLSRAAPRPGLGKTARRTPSARPTAAAGARRAPNCRPGPTNAGRGGEVRAAGGACEPLGGRRGEAARGEGRGEAAPKPLRNAMPGATPLGVFAPFPLEGADGLTPHPE